jgi:hypothetical protein
MKMYIIERGAEYWSEKGFWQLNQYCPTYFDSKEKAQKQIDKMPVVEGFWAKVIELNIKL